MASETTQMKPRPKCIGHGIDCHCEKCEPPDWPGEFVNPRPHDERFPLGDSRCGCRECYFCGRPRPEWPAGLQCDGGADDLDSLRRKLLYWRIFGVIMAIGFLVACLI